MKTKVMLIALISAFLLPVAAYAADTNQVTNINISVQNVFAIEFYTDANVIYTSVVPFTNVDPNESLVYPDGRQENDGKSDVGVVCLSNAGVPWYLKIHLTPTGSFSAAKLKYYLDQPYSRNTGGRADGALAQSANWYSFNTTATTVYTAGVADQTNLPFGTLSTFSYALDPTGLEAGKAYSATITYTMTTAA